MLKGLYIMNKNDFEKVYTKNIRDQISKLVKVEHPLKTKDNILENAGVLQDIDVIFSSWGGPLLSQEFLKAAPRLKAVFYAAGSVKGIMTDAAWDRGIVISSAYAANAIPVAEYTLSQIFFSLKRGWEFVRDIKLTGKYTKRISREIPGAYNRTVGIISLGMVGKKVCELLKPFDLKVLAYDPFVSEEQAASLNVELCSLDDIFRRSDIVSLHTPWLKETEGMINGDLFELMKTGATFINTSRGAVVNEREMIEVLSKRSDLTAVLDVTYPEPPEDGSPIITLPNIILTPHIAGSEGSECERMAQYMVEELERYINKEPLSWEITKNKISILA